tara:strand:- start:461 stop:1369 length:909 start_codon:yes stop_codon:yes gene_type:complete
MAEAILLLLFCLILVFAMLVEEREVVHNERLSKAKRTAKEATQALSKLEQEMQRKVELADAPYVTVVSELADTQTVLIANGLPESPRDLERVLSELAKKRRENAKKLRILEEDWQELTDVLKPAATPGQTPDETAQGLVDEHHATKMRGQASETKLAAEHLKLKRELRNSKGQISNLKQQLRGTGKGTDHPPCWATLEGKSQYLFHITLKSKGLVVRDIAPPERREDKAALPLKEILRNRGRTLSVSQFRKTVWPVVDWSIRRECRFFVKVQDRTRSGEKDIYKRLLHAVGTYFYPYLVPNK